MEIEVKEKICKEFYFRKTLKTGALTRYVIILDGKLVQSSGKRFSRSGAHGEEYYCLSKDQWDRAWIIKFEISNSGKRYVDFSDNIPPNVKAIIYQKFIYENEDIAKILVDLKVI
jgi:hypothetical protein